DNPGWALILTWWLKPLYDRVLLHVYSRRVFGEEVNISEILSALPGLLRRTGLLKHLTIYRFDFTRSFRLPVWQLEGLKGKKRSERTHALARRSGGYATWLTLICLHLEAFIQLAILGLVWMFVPEVIIKSIWEYFWNLLSGDTFPYWFLLASNIIYYLGITIIEPFFVAAGFALYLNRRTLLEAWDIEMTFRSLANRLSALKAPGGKIAASLLLVCLMFSGATPQPALALDINASDSDKEPLASQHLPAEQSATVIKQVLADKDFGGKRTEEQWKLKDFNIDRSDDDSSTDLSWIEDVVRALANVMEILLWAGVILLVLFLIFRISRMVNPDAFKTDRSTRVVPAVISGLDIRPESLPDDVAAAARQLWLDGQYRDAMGLLYRGTVSSLVHIYDVELTEGATEGDVLVSAEPRLRSETHQFLDQITRLWQSIAYAHRQPDETQALPLFDHWQQHFGQAASDAQVIEA
ncbi:MAG: hypothetical protein OQL16_05315, partial [Gammaproteobacteria bacterium]|nr:hypothetical protein [Gammaproteobacteria bacterium]